jgi:EmrB/QacA subfamily drug resistance transporter
LNGLIVAEIKTATPAGLADEGSDVSGRWVLFVTILASSMAFIDGSALNVALPSLQADLGASGAQLLWVVNGYLLMLAALILIGGSLGDQLGRKKIFMAGIGLFLLASLACGLAPSIAFLTGARIAQGVGGALMIPGSLAIIGASFAPERRGRAIGTWSAATTLVTIGGPILGGFLAQVGLWRGVFLINLPLGLAALVVLALKVPESHDQRSSGSIDIAGALLVSLGLAGLTYGFICVPDYGFADPRVFITLVGGALALAAFVLLEARATHPMIPLKLFRSRTFTGTNLLTLFLYGALNVGTFFLSLNLVQVQGYSQSLAGFAFTPFAVVLALLSRLAGGLADRYGPRLPLMVGPALAGLGFLLLALVGLTGGPAEYWTTFFPGVVVFGVGMALTVAPLTATVMGAVPGYFAGTASGINNAVSRTAGVLALAILGAVALLLFAGALETRAVALGLPVEARTALVASASQLGAAHPPAGMMPAQTEAAARAIRLAFVDVFRTILLICAALSWISAAMAALFVEKE